MYNAGIERAQHEVKKELSPRLRDYRAPMEVIVRDTEGAIYVGNHTARKVLGGATPCERLHAPGRRMSFTRKERHAILGDVADITQAICRRLADRTERGRATTRRYAVETWLKTQGLITVTQSDGVLPNFLPTESHN